MRLSKDLAYRIKRFLGGESGVVEKVESVPLSDSSGQIINYPKDYYGHYPMQITFRNPLGELVTKQSPIFTENLPDNIGLFRIEVYRTYKPGDTFPF